jgi:hypothetical protein
MITLSDSRQKHRSASSLQKREIVMKTTYRLLVQSEEKSRNILETALYGLVAVSVSAAIWQFANEPAMPTYRDSAPTSQQTQIAS